MEKPTPSHPITINDVAQKVGLHKSTVSLALSGKGTIAAATRHRIQNTAREMGYEPNAMAQRLAQRQGTTTLCLFSGTLDVGLATEKVLRIQKMLSLHGFEAPLYTASSTEMQIAQIRQICRQRPRALILNAHYIHTDTFPELERYQKNGGILISYDAPLPLECDQVLFDREDNTYQATRHLLACGHRRIGFTLSGNSLSQSAEKLQTPRLQGFRKALEEDGVTYRPEWVFYNTTYEAGGAEMAQKYLSLAERPTALAIVNDYVALAFMAQVRKAGVRIPEDISIIGHDNQPIAAYCPVPLTAMNQPIEAITTAVVKRLLARLEGDTSPLEQTIIRGELTVRDSVRQLTV
jgi:DNA-binding LacI/PurR family transcriptional regulator